MDLKEKKSQKGNSIGKHRKLYRRLDFYRDGGY